jgi:hypothetical protein
MVNKGETYFAADGGSQGKFGSLVFDWKLEKKKLTDIGFWFFSWILDLVQKLTERFSRIMFMVFSVGIGFGLILSINQLLLQR